MACGMTYPHQPGSPWFDGADAYEAYLNEMYGRLQRDAAPMTIKIRPQPYSWHDKSGCALTSAQDDGGAGK